MAQKGTFKPNKEKKKPKKNGKKGALKMITQNKLINFGGGY